MVLSSGRDVRLMHVMNFDVVVCAGNAPDQIDGFLTGRATSTENIDLFFFYSKPLLIPPL